MVTDNLDSVQIPIKPQDRIPGLYQQLESISFNVPPGEEQLSRRVPVLTQIKQALDDSISREDGLSLNQKLNKCGNEQVTQAYDVVIQRVLNETTLMDDIVFAGIAHYALHGVSNSDGSTTDIISTTKVGGTRVLFWSEAPIGRALGYFFPKINFIFSRVDKPNRKSVLRSISMSGGLPDGFSVLLHEKTHSLQDSTLGWLSSDPDQALFEAQALYNESLVMQTPKDTTRNLINRYHVDEVNAVYATKTVQRLYALGYDSRKIAHLMAHPGKPSGEKYPKIDKIIKKEAEKMGIVSDAGMDLLVQNWQLEKEISRKKAQMIAREEMGKVA